MPLIWTISNHYTLSISLFTGLRIVHYSLCMEIPVGTDYLPLLSQRLLKDGSKNRLISIRILRSGDHFPTNYLFLFPPFCSDHGFLRILIWLVLWRLLRNTLIFCLCILYLSCLFDCMSTVILTIWLLAMWLFSSSCQVIVRRYFETIKFYIFAHNLMEGTGTPVYVLSNQLIAFISSEII